jgi:hypothetical protein
MKNRMFIIRFLLIICIFATPALLLMNCEENQDTEDKNITHVATLTGGCNGEEFITLKSEDLDTQDTVIFSLVHEDTLSAYVGINYICCAPFTSETSIISDTLFMEISDTCSQPYNTCYCRCYCYYTWDFKFVDFEEKEYYFIVYLDDPREENIIIFREGRIDLSQ